MGLAQQWKRDYESEGSTLANQMSLSRLIGGVILAIILCFVKMITIYYPTIDDIYWRWPAFVICFALVLTDWADGQVARSDKFKGGVTDLGKKLDPLADKVLIVSVYMALAACFYYWLIPLAILIALRESFVTYIRYCAEQKKGIVISARWSGKIKMACQSVTLLWLIAPYSDLYVVITYTLVLTTGLVTIWSGVEYGFKFSKYILD